MASTNFAPVATVPFVGNSQGPSTMPLMSEGGIEQGPKLLRLLSFCAASGSLFCTIWSMINPLAAVFHPVMYILYTYIAVFALTTMLFEANPDWIQKSEALIGYQDLLIRYCSFLTLMVGRGLFYIFQATLWLSLVQSFSQIVELIAAANLFIAGVLHIFGHWGIMPHQIAQRAIYQAEKVTGRDLDGDGVIAASP